MFDALKNTSSLEELKSCFKKLARKFHPDMGGSEESFKELNAIYSSLLDARSFGYGSDFDLELEKMASSFAHCEGLVVEVVGSWIWVGGETWSWKEFIKQKGFRFSRKRKKWYFHKDEEGKKRRSSSKSYEELKSVFGYKPVNVSGRAALSV